MHKSSCGLSLLLSGEAGDQGPLSLVIVSLPYYNKGTRLPKSVRDSPSRELEGTEGFSQTPSARLPHFQWAQMR